jgi:hypothetical protein
MNAYRLFDEKPSEMQGKIDEKYTRFGSYSNSFICASATTRLLNNHGFR